ncbi:GtrA family protein [Olivibacter ginsenosidimutans]|uniref:GtrA family protein n=1 Tax=Olivibacter ginsenosidimutans TaxID=1176537 RepID=UPI0031F1020D
MKKNNFYTFLKAQFSAFFGGIVDYLTMIACTELLHIHYTISIVIGGVIGAIINFTINRHWTFGASGIRAKDHLTIQLMKFITMVGGSIVLKSSGTYLLTEGVHADYRISRIIVDILVSLGFNYTLQRYWVFKRNTP